MTWQSQLPCKLVATWHIAYRQYVTYLPFPAEDLSGFHVMGRGWSTRQYGGRDLVIELHDELLLP